MPRNFRPLHRLCCCFLLLAAWLSGQAEAREKPAFKAGVASRVITPREALWMAGYAARNKPAQGKAQDLFVKALALEDASGGKVVLVTTDLLGLPRELADAVAAEVRKRTGLARERLMLTSSHTHCGPVLDSPNRDMYSLPADQPKKIAAYTEKLKGQLIDAVVAALKDLKPAQLSVGKGMARFAVNRREETAKGVILGVNPKGPVEHDVPVLRVESADGKLQAVVFGYACHNTTLDFYEWCGDYAGFAQAYLEKERPGALAMFWMGCGGDANPHPRRKLELAQKHGRELANAVKEVLRGKMTPVQGTFAARYGEIALPFARLPGKEQLKAEAKSTQTALRNRAKRLLKTLEATGKLDDHYRHYPVQVWRLGDGVVWVALGGEVVVDYARRLRKELRVKGPLWVTAYANNVMSYIPSARVLEEGGYEADLSQVYYGMPAKWAPAIEDRIVRKVAEYVKAVGKQR